MSKSDCRPRSSSRSCRCQPIACQRLGHRGRVDLIVCLFVIGEQGLSVILVQARIVADVHFALDEFLIDQFLRRLPPRSEAEIRASRDSGMRSAGCAGRFRCRRSILSPTEMAIRSTITALGRDRAAGSSKASTVASSDRHARHQNACPIEKKNWKWLICCSDAWHVLGRRALHELRVVARKSVVFRRVDAVGKIEPQRPDRCLVPHAETQPREPYSRNPPGSSAPREKISRPDWNRCSRRLQTVRR